MKVYDVHDDIRGAGLTHYEEYVQKVAEEKALLKEDIAMLEEEKMQVLNACNLKNVCFVGTFIITSQMQRKHVV